MASYRPKPLAHQPTRPREPRLTSNGSGGGVDHSLREPALFILFIAIALILVAQLVHLQVFAADRLGTQALGQRSYPVIIPAKRGTIYDRNHNVLARSIDTTTITANPKEIDDPKATATILASLLGGNFDDYYPLLTIADTTYVCILEDGEFELAEKLSNCSKALKEPPDPKVTDVNPYASFSASALNGIYCKQDTLRVYDYGSVGAQVIGGVTTDIRDKDIGGIKYKIEYTKGLYGLEQMYDAVLAGTDGMLKTEYAQLTDNPLSGQPIPGSEREEVAPVDGQDIVISLDIELQERVESELDRAGTEGETNNGSALVLNGANGEILAAASLPLANRDGMSEEDIKNGATDLKAVYQSFEPGSTFKTLTAAAVLEEGVMGTEDVIYVPATRDFDKGNGEVYTVKDAHPRPAMDMSFRTIIAQSSNVGMTLVKDRLGDQKLSDYLESFGVGQTTHVDLFNEGCGLLITNKYWVEDKKAKLSYWLYWSDIDAASVSYGQGPVETTPLQMACFYGAVANDGIWYHPHFLIDRPQAANRSELADQYERLMRSDTASTLTSMLSSVVTDGTGQSAQIEGYTVAGKTGTAQKAIRETDEGYDGVSKGYLPDQHIVSFVGFLPDSEEKLVCITTLDNPIGALGNSPTGPLFASIMSFAAERYEVPTSQEAQTRSAGGR